MMFLSYKMSFQRALLAISLPLLAFSALSQAQVYRWVDSNGEVRYTDRPSPESLKGKAENRAQEVEIQESFPVQNKSASNHMDASRYYRKQTKTQISSSSPKSTKHSVSEDTKVLLQQQKEEADQWFIENCVYFSKVTKIQASPRDLWVDQQKRKNTKTMTKAEKEREKRLEKLVENRVKQNKQFNQYVNSKGLVNVSPNITKEGLRNAYQLKMGGKVRVESFQLACEDEEGNPLADLDKYAALVNYPQSINPEDMDQFIANNPDFRIE